MTEEISANRGDLEAGDGEKTDGEKDETDENLDERKTSFVMEHASVHH